MTELDMDASEIKSLGRILSGMYEFKRGGDGRERLIDEAGLGTILSQVRLDGEPGNVAWDIIKRLRRYGPMPKESHVHALGALLRHVLETPDLPQDEARIIVVLMLKYNLIQDAEYFRPLKDRFNISNVDLQPTKPTFAGLTVSQRQQLHQALMSAFPPHAALSQMINMRLHENLEEITEIGTLEDMIQELIEWSEANGRTEELIRKARAHNPNDPVLKAVCKEIL